MLCYLKTVCFRSEISERFLTLYILFRIIVYLVIKMESRKMTIGFIISVLFIISIMPVQSAPAQYLFIINDELNLGAKFWPGDEFHQYSLPNGWHVYENGKFVNDYENLESLCKSIGYTYIGAINEDWTPDDSKFEVSGLQINYYLIALIALVAISICTIVLILLHKRKIF